ncbi:MAG: hypothetical protein LBC35_07410 [Coriobacteriales bacterium]|nr:hypothetical protein [Coriobacteriales bacterium]
MAVVCALLLSGCGAQQSQSEIATAWETGYAIGMVETRMNERISFIKFYDEDLNLVESATLPYADLENEWYKPVRFGDSLYIIPQGYRQVKNDRMALELNLRTGERIEYHIDRPSIQSIAATNDYIFTMDNINATTHITRSDRLTHETIDIEQEKSLYNALYAQGDILYAFLQVFPENYTDLIVYDLDLNELARYPLGAFGEIGMLSDMIDGQLYFSTSRLKDVQTNSYPGLSDYDHYIVRFTPETGLMEEVVTSDYSLEDVHMYGDYIIVMQRDVNFPEYNQALFLDKETLEIVAQQPLDYHPRHSLIVGDRLYVVVGSYPTYLRAYKIEGTVLELVAEVTTDEFVSGLFLH